VVEADGLENRYTRKGIVGSNPTLSANKAYSYLKATMGSILVARRAGM
jgi:uncharacterized protein affecting Mg2+/Co2+ transport